MLGLKKIQDYIDWSDLFFVLCMVNVALPKLLDGINEVVKVTIMGTVVVGILVLAFSPRKTVLKVEYNKPMNGIDILLVGVSLIMAISMLVATSKWIVFGSLVGILIAYACFKQLNLRK